MKIRISQSQYGDSLPQYLPNVINSRVDISPTEAVKVLYNNQGTFWNNPRHNIFKHTSEVRPLILMLLVKTRFTLINISVSRKKVILFFVFSVESINEVCLPS